MKSSPYINIDLYYNVEGRRSIRNKRLTGSRNEDVVDNINASGV